MPSCMRAPPLRTRHEWQVATLGQLHGEGDLLAHHVAHRATHEAEVGHGKHRARPATFAVPVMTASGNPVFSRAWVNRSA